MDTEAILLGIAIGDAFGAGIEFQDRNWIKKHIDFSKLVDVRGKIKGQEGRAEFAQNYHPWDYTDDAEMTLGLVEALLCEKEFTPDLLVDYWTREYQKGIDQKGYGRNGHGSMRWVFSGEKTIKEVRNFQRNRQFPGNAPPMRAVPLGLILPHQIINYAIINADATHPHPKARAASILVAKASEYLLVKQKESKDIINFCARYIRLVDSETYDHLQQVNQLPVPSQLSEADYKTLCGPQPIEAPRFLPGINGLPSDSMLTAGAVLYILKFAENTMEGLREAIYLGGDVDSVASICTGILAGKYGLGSLPTYMLEKVEGKAYIKSVAKRFSAYLQRQNKGL